MQKTNKEKAPTALASSGQSRHKLSLYQGRPTPTHDSRTHRAVARRRMRAWPGSSAAHRSPQALPCQRCARTGRRQRALELRPTYCTSLTPTMHRPGRLAPRQATRADSRQAPQPAEHIAAATSFQGAAQRVPHDLSLQVHARIGIDVLPGPGQPSVPAGAACGGRHSSQYTPLMR